MAAYDLITENQAQTALPTLKTAQVADLPAVITAVSRAFEHTCGRKHALWNFDKVYRPGRTRRIQLDSWPVVPGARFKTDLSVPMVIQNSDALTNQFAYIYPTPVSTTSLQIASYTFVRIASGITTTQTVSFSGLNTLTDLMNAVNGLGGGWNAIIQGSGQGYVNYPLVAVSEINYDPGTMGALNQQAEVRIYERDISRVVLNDRSGIVELTENRPTAFRYADLAYGIGFGWSWAAAAEPRHAGVRAIYRAGYAVQAADLAAGYEPVPDDLLRAAIISVQATLEATVSPSKKQESDGAYTYLKTDDGPAVIPQAAMRILLSSRYSSFRLPNFM